MERELLLLYIMAAFTGVAAVALVIMAGMMFGVYRAASLIRRQSSDFFSEWQPLAGEARKAVEELRYSSGELLADMRALTASSRKQMDKVDVILTDLSESARVQLGRIDKSLQENLEKFEETAAAVQQTVMTPVRQAHGIAAAINAFLGHLAAGRRPRVDQATLDEEMFI
jgi:hypothetical protein